MKTPNGTEARIVDNENRMNFLHYLFGVDYVIAETCVYIYAKRYLENYRGGDWKLHQFPDGGYMAPDIDRIVVCNPENWFEQEMSGEAAGLFITALVLNHRAWMYSRHDQEELCELFCSRHESIMDFICNHEERKLILSALD